MKQAIVEKIAAELREGITSERQVVYLLVQIRKLMELDEEQKNYPALNFYCNWVAHPRLDRKDAQEIVRLFDRWEAVMGEEDEIHLFSEVNEVLELFKFRREFDDFLKRYGLDSTLTGVDGKWIDFLAYYVRVIEDCPLQCTGLAFTDAVVVKVIARQFNELLIEWSWFSKKQSTRLGHLTWFSFSEAIEHGD